MSVNVYHHAVLTAMLMAKAHESRTAPAIKAEAHALLEKYGSEFITLNDARWPRQLDDLGATGPAGLWIRGHGDIGALGNLVTIDGSRTPTDYGLQLVDIAVEGLIGAGKTVVSSTNAGVGRRAMETAWYSPGSVVPSIGVVSGGFSEGATEQLLISLCAPGTPASKTSAIEARNLLAALSGTTVIIEADDTALALSTARLAAALNRKVGACPGSIFSKESRGTHQLIRDGIASMVTGMDDILNL